MLRPPLSLLALGLVASSSSSLAATAGSFADAGNTLVSAMMVRPLPSPPFCSDFPQMFLGNEQKMYILDKAEGNAAQIAGHPAWGSVWWVYRHLLPMVTDPVS